MAYEKQTWQTGETITAEKLNHMEDGIGVGNSGYQITYTTLTDETLSCTNNSDVLFGNYTHTRATADGLKQYLRFGLPKNTKGAPFRYKVTFDGSVEYLELNIYTHTDGKTYAVLEGASYIIYRSVSAASDTTYIDTAESGEHTLKVESVAITPSDEFLMVLEYCKDASESSDDHYAE